MENSGGRVKEKVEMGVEERCFKEGKGDKGTGGGHGEGCYMGIQFFLRMCCVGGGGSDAGNNVVTVIIIVVITVMKWI